ncbi:MAG: hypothetical protein HON53_18550 [Planctomycetaceae bacterium]|jgi:signal transduction histidine kinase|nr:hypothetical protein [Planctomycetaceae bacterium]MBT6158000.1 hypothetical protein [Planctomycetaceae bacterium]MBT6484789.1 hypothetical protein [Planctomycetaceae bacterium]MBT6494114.1 hypothetical protein [Planctomycetaceae bacterium]
MSDPKLEHGYNQTPNTHDSVEWLVSDPDVTSRQKFLDKACELCGPNTVAMLWLYDSGHKDLYLDRIAPNKSSVVDTQSLQRIWVACKDSNASIEELIDPRQIPTIAAWCDKHAVPLSNIKTVQLRLKQEKELQGVLQLFVQHQLHENQCGQLRLLARGLTRIVETRRSQRREKVARKLRKNLDLRRPADKWFERAAGVLRDNVEAELCLFFRMDRDLTFQCCAAESLIGNVEKKQFVAGRNSLTRIVAERKLKNIRVLDFQDKQEWQQLFDHSECDEKLVEAIKSVVPSGSLQTVMMMPVVVDQHTFAVGMLINKTKHLARRFSQTDQQILEAACESLAGVIPGTVNYRAMRDLSELAFDGSLEDAETREKFHDWLANNLPGLESSALLVFDPHRHDADSMELRHLGGDEWFQDPDVVRHAPRETYQASRRHADSQCLRYVTEIPRLNQYEGKLALGFERGYISSHEENLVAYACAELSHMLRAEQMVREQTETLVQIRHVVRAGLSGILHVQVAKDIYDRVCRRNEGDISEIQTGARFRRHLETADEYSRRTNNLIEESRFLLGRITRNRLQIGSQSVSDLIKDVRRCLERYAERRHLKLFVENRLPYNFSEASMDRALMEIVVFNLLDNAIKYSFRDQIVRMEAAFSGGRNWTLDIINSGVYIPPEDREAIFQRFVRKTASQRQARRRPGTGLGLAVAREVVAAHGGTLTCASSDRGARPNDPALTVFRLIMPRNVKSPELPHDGS